eukprot:TRINITY_DN786_c0_g2_i1.p1 TRINITY_DN786_c0_g2~~TRINITY_DN786_c0_g2_i1.p1  ORF type:complete len:552 (-),score=33.26 TRINITY_DN786_c0_g2_i1:2008-3663(-)
MTDTYFKFIAITVLFINTYSQSTITLTTQILQQPQQEAQEIAKENNGSTGIILLGDDPRTCNIMGEVEIQGEDIWMGPRPIYTLSPQECCRQCKTQENCNAWIWCSNLDGCNGTSGSYTQCLLRTYMTESPQYKNEGQGWISGYTVSNCPALRRQRQLANYTDFQDNCNDKDKMCSQCLCELQQEFEEYGGTWWDLGFCMESMFLGPLSLPENMGGAGIPEQNIESLRQCAISSTPCEKYDNSTIYYTAGVAYDVNVDGNDCVNGIEPQECAQNCETNPKCDAFSYHAVKLGGTCCLLTNPTKEVSFSKEGWQTYFRIESGFDPDKLIILESVQVNQLQTLPDLSMFEFAFSVAAQEDLDGDWQESLILGSGCGACHDEPPPQTKFTCDQFSSWGLCDEGFLAEADFPNGYCALTCDRCSCVGLPQENGTSVQPAPPTIEGLQVPIDDPCFCSDFPPKDYTCELVNSLGLCDRFVKDKNSPLPEGYCQTTCGRCDCPTDKLCICSDVVPSGQWPCDRQKKWGKCEDEWMFNAPTKGGYCQITCERCPCIMY